jgi:hypothetical protein
MSPETSSQAANAIQSRTIYKCCRDYIFSLSWLVFLSLTSSLFADVFMRIGKQPGTIMEQAGGRAIHQADIQLNNQPARLIVMGFDRSIESVAPVLARQLDLPTPDIGLSYDGMELNGSSNGRELNLYLLPGGKPDSTLAMLVDKAASGSSAENTKQPDWGDIPHPSAAIPVFSAVNENTRTKFAVGLANASPEALQLEMETQMTRLGWSLTAPRPPHNSMAMYARGNAMLLVFTQPPNDNQAKTRITILQRPGNKP